MSLRATLTATRNWALNCPTVSILTDWLSANRSLRLRSFWFIFLFLALPFAVVTRLVVGCPRIFRFFAYLISDDQRPSNRFHDKAKVGALLDDSRTVISLLNNEKFPRDPCDHCDNAASRFHKRRTAAVPYGRGLGLAWSGHQGREGDWVCRPHICHSLCSFSWSSLIEFRAPHSDGDE